MTSSYKNTNNKDKNSKYITKGNFDFQYSDYQKLKLAEQYNELYLKQYNANKENDKIIENKKIFNLSLNDLFKNTSIVFSNLLNDIVIFMNQDKKTINDFFIIFTQKERLIYIGLLCVLLAFSMWIIDVSK
jgi:CRISPR/Cas system CMR subunit Cmr6 (Cas7 group RAMP superfamily)